MENFEEMIEKARQGDKIMAEKVATAYMKGMGTEKDINKAVEFFEIAAKNGSAMAYYQLGKAYQTGNGVNADITKAKEYYQKSADMGYITAVNLLKKMETEENGTNNIKAKATSGIAYQAPPAPNVPNNTKVQNNNSNKSSEHYSQKSKMTAALLAVFLGTIGGENWYLGYITKAVIQLVLSFTGISTIWGFVDAYLIITGKINKDAKGDVLC